MMRASNPVSVTVTPKPFQKPLKFGSLPAADDKPLVFRPITSWREFMDGVSASSNKMQHYAAVLTYDGSRHQQSVQALLASQDFVNAAPNMEFYALDCSQTKGPWVTGNGMQVQPSENPRLVIFEHIAGMPTNRGSNGLSLANLKDPTPVTAWLQKNFPGPDAKPGDLAVLHDTRGRYLPEKGWIDPKKDSGEAPGKKSSAPIWDGRIIGWYTPPGLEEKCMAGGPVKHNKTIIVGGNYAHSFGELEPDDFPAPQATSGGGSSDLTGSSPDVSSKPGGIPTITDSHSSKSMGHMPPSGVKARHRFTVLPEGSNRHEITEGMAEYRARTDEAFKKLRDTDALTRLILEPTRFPYDFFSKDKQSVGSGYTTPSYHWPGLSDEKREKLHKKIPILPLEDQPTVLIGTPNLKPTPYEPFADGETPIIIDVDGKPLKAPEGKLVGMTRDPYSIGRELFEAYWRKVAGLRDKEQDGETPVVTGVNEKPLKATVLPDPAETMAQYLDRLAQDPDALRRSIESPGKRFQATFGDPSWKKPHTKMLTLQYEPFSEGETPIIIDVDGKPLKAPPPKPASTVLQEFLRHWDNIRLQNPPLRLRKLSVPPLVGNHEKRQAADTADPVIVVQAPKKPE